MIDTTLEFCFLFEGVHFNREIGASILAHPAPDTIVGPGGEYFAAPQFQHLLRAKCYANIAALAVVFPNDMKEFFLWFCHIFALIYVLPHSI